MSKPKGWVKIWREIKRPVKQIGQAVYSLYAVKGACKKGLDAYFVPNNEDVYKNIDCLEFTITSKCNYACEYCVAKLGKNKNQDMIHASDKTIENFKIVLSKIKKNSRVKITGGEPIIHPKFFETAKEVVKNGHRLVVGTNFSLPNHHFEQVIDAIEDGEFRVIASLHLSQVESVDSFVNKVISLKKYGQSKITISVVSVVTEENYEILKGAKEKLALEGVKLSFQHLKTNDGDFVEYAPHIMQHFPEKHISKRLKGFKSYGTICAAGYRFLKIRASGNVSRCFSEHKNLYDLGNINNLCQPLRIPLPCLASKCTCLLPINNGLIDFENCDLELANEIDSINDNCPFQSPRITANDQ